MNAAAQNAFAWSRLRLTKQDWLRAVAAGAAFGLVLTTGLVAMTAWQCGGICLPEVAVNAVLSLAGGILGLGPVAVYGGRRA
jgi:hypothetical protein